MIVLYGGSFNPPTIGHFNLVKELNDKFVIKKIIIIPSFKSATKKLLDFKHRLTMLNMMFKKVKNVEVSDYEKKVQFKGTYYELLEIYKKYGEKPYLAIGADNFKDLANWINYKKLISEFPIIVFNRNKSLAWAKIDKFNKDNNSNLMFVDLKEESSSTLVREDFEKYKEYLTPEIYKYLKKKKINFNNV